MTEAISRLDDHLRYKPSKLLGATLHDKVLSTIQECYEDGSISGKLEDIVSDVHHGLCETKLMSELSRAALNVLVCLPARFK